MTGVRPFTFWASVRGHGCVKVGDDKHPLLLTVALRRVAVTCWVCLIHTGCIVRCILAQFNGAA